jgi:hypothetical protein
MINETTIKKTVDMFEATIRQMVNDRQASGSFSIPGAPAISCIVTVMPTAQADQIMRTKSAAEDIATVATEAAGTFSTLLKAATGILGKHTGR